MTDKEIMIDSIDVSGCEFLWKERLPKKVCNNGNLDCDCISNPNCYYKQLKRKEQALDEIGKLIPKFESSDGCDYGDFDCENCSDLDEDTVCAYKLKKVIKGIINKVKGETNEES